MSRKTYFLKSAETDFIEIAWSIAERSGSAEIGETFAAQLRVRCERFASLGGILGSARPELGQGTRSTSHKGYIIFFRYTDDAVEIINILHASRDAIAYFTDDTGGD